RRVPREPRLAAGAPLALPLPAGGFAVFEVVESPVLDPALQRRFPDIRTYRGQGTEARTASVRWDLTPRGFHAMILSAAGTTLIDLLEEGDTGRYLVRAKRDAPPG